MAGNARGWRPTTFASVPEGWAGKIASSVLVLNFFFKLMLFIELFAIVCTLVHFSFVNIVLIRKKYKHIFEPKTTFKNSFIE